MKIKHLSIAVVLLIISSTMSSQAQNDEQRLFLIIGQSNAAGRDTNFDFNDLDLPSPNVNLLDDNGVFVEATQPLNQFSTIRKDIDLQGVNMGLEFGKEINTLVGGEINLVVNPRGGTRVAQWRRDNDAGYFNEALARVLEAQETCDCTLDGILWHQGEGNVSSDDGTFTNSYFSSLSNMIMEFREELNSDVPFIVGQLAPDQFRFEAFNEALQMVSEPEFGVSDVDWVSSEGLSTISEEDITHFNAESTREFGRRYAGVMANFLDAIEVLSVNEVAGNTLVNIYPNPATDVITIDTSNQLSDYSSSLYNLDGKLIRTAVNTNRIPVSDVASGIYLLEITDQQSGQTTVKKVAINK